MLESSGQEQDHRRPSSDVKAGGHPVEFAHHARGQPRRDRQRSVSPGRRPRHGVPRYVVPPSRASSRAGSCAESACRCWKLLGSRLSGPEWPLLPPNSGQSQEHAQVAPPALSGLLRASSGVGMSADIHLVACEQLWELCPRWASVQLRGSQPAWAPGYATEMPRVGPEMEVHGLSLHDQPTDHLPWVPQTAVPVMGWWCRR